MTGAMNSPPPVAFSMLKRMGTFGTIWPMALSTVTRSVTVLARSPELGATTVELAWRDIRAASAGDG